MTKLMEAVREAIPGLTRFDNRVDLSPFIALQNENAWAVQKSMLFHNIGVFYSLVPKNACTTILSALASANGLTTPWFQDRNRIHNIQPKFNAFNDLDRFHDDTFKIIAFRDPFKRLLSAFRNKLIERRSENFNATQFFEQRLDKPITECRFSDVVRISDHFAHWALEQHFAPQWSFLFYDRYDLVIDADAPIHRLDIGSRELPLAWHNHKTVEMANQDIGDATIGEIRAYVAKTGKYPRTEEAAQIFRSNLQPGGNFERDFRLYRTLKRLPD